MGRLHQTSRAREGCLRHSGLALPTLVAFSFHVFCTLLLLGII